MFARIQTRADAAYMSRILGRLFIVHSIVLSAGDFFRDPLVGLFEFALLAACGYSVSYRNSICGAAFGLLATLVILCATIWNLAMHSEGRLGFFLSGFAVFVSIRMLEATVKSSRLS